MVIHTVTEYITVIDKLKTIIPMRSQREYQLFLIINMYIHLNSYTADIAITKNIS